MKVDEKVIIREEKVDKKTPIVGQEKSYSIEIVEKAKVVGEFLNQDYRGYLDFVACNSSLSIE